MCSNPDLIEKTKIPNENCIMEVAKTKVVFFQDIHFSGRFQLGGVGLDENTVDIFDFHDHR